MKEDVVIVGAGPAGLAVAYFLQKLGVRYVVVERGQIAESWHHHYDGLRLHTLKQVSALPGSPLPENYPDFPSKEQMVAYWQGYVARWGLRVQEGVRVERAVYHAYHQTWHVGTSGGEMTAGVLVAATGIWSTPYRPQFVDEELFAGEIRHAQQYKNGAEYAGKRVLVVGGGNTGTEVAVGLAQAGAEVTILMAEGTTFALPPTSPTAVRLSATILPHLPTRVGHWLLQRTRPDFRYLGINPPDKPLAQAYPVVGLALPQAVAAGRVKLVTAVIERFTAEGVLLQDNTAVSCDAVILATGYRPTLGFVAGEVAVDEEHGRVQTDRHSRSLKNPRLFCVGYQYPALSGWLQALPRVAERAANAIAREVRRK
jgi:cation diffusion facilitator CzcD-associated flavoprotein CzcO